MIQERIDHAKRNRAVCEYLRGTEYYDWIVTTAFYTVVQYTMGALFPLKIFHNGEERSFATISQYYQFREEECADFTSKHSMQSNLVAERLPDLRFVYRKLQNKSHFARYSSYRISKDEADYMHGLMVRIAEECERVITRQTS